MIFYFLETEEPAEQHVYCTPDCGLPTQVP